MNVASIGWIKRTRAREVVSGLEGLAAATVDDVGFTPGRNDYSAPERAMRPHPLKGSMSVAKNAILIRCRTW